MRRIVALLTLTVLAACGGDSTAASASVVGTWNLSTVNGAPLPFVTQAANPKVEILSDQYVISTNGTFTETTNVRFTQGTSVTSSTGSDAGTYTVNGSSVSLRINGDVTAVTGSFSGNTLTLVDGTFTLLYTRQ